MLPVVLVRGARSGEAECAHCSPGTRMAPACPGGLSTATAHKHPPLPASAFLGQGHVGRIADRTLHIPPLALPQPLLHPEPSLAWPRGSAGELLRVGTAGWAGRVAWDSPPHCGAPGPGGPSFLRKRQLAVDSTHNPPHLQAASGFQGTDPHQVPTPEPAKLHPNQAVSAEGTGLGWGKQLGTTSVSKRHCPALQQGRSLSEDSHRPGWVRPRPGEPGGG